MCSVHCCYISVNTDSLKQMLDCLKHLWDLVVLKDNSTCRQEQGQRQTYIFTSKINHPELRRATPVWYFSRERTGLQDADDELLL